MPERFNILSLSGGGFLGLYTVSVLARLEEMYEAPIAKSFELLAGTSVGGIIALGLANEVPAKRIQAAFEKHGATIFSNRAAPSSFFDSLLDIGRSALRPKYDDGNLHDTITEIVGVTTKMADLKHPVIVPAVNLSKGLPQIFKTGHHPDFRVDPKRNVVDVALATSAAPTYFPIAEINDELFADGGLYANSPDLLALHEAEHFLSQKVGNIHVLSIGTTTSQFSFAHAHGRRLGLLGWLTDQRLVNVMIASQQHSVNYMMGHRLGNRYLRLDASQSKEQERHLALDVATKDAQKTVRALAASTVQENINNAQLQSFFLHNAATPVFFNNGL